MQRSKRSRTARKTNDDFVDLDSDEFAEAIAEEDEDRPKKQQKRGSSKKEKETPPPEPEGSDEEYHEVEDEAEFHSAEEEGQQELAEVSDTADDEGQQDSEPEFDGTQSDDSSAPKKGKKGKKQAKEKKTRKKRLSTKRLCASFAKAQYHLTDKDLAQLTDVEYRENPHGAFYAQMKLYLVRELEALAKAKQERKAMLAASAEERAAARAEEARARARERAAEAQRRIEGLGTKQE